MVSLIQFLRVDTAERRWRRARHSAGLVFGLAGLYLAACAVTASAERGAAAVPKESGEGESGLGTQNGGVAAATDQADEVPIVQSTNTALPPIEDLEQAVADALGLRLLANGKAEQERRMKILLRRLASWAPGGKPIEIYTRRCRPVRATRANPGLWAWELTLREQIWNWEQPTTSKTFGQLSRVTRDAAWWSAGFVTPAIRCEKYVVTETHCVGGGIQRCSQCEGLHLEPRLVPDPFAASYVGIEHEVIIFEPSHDVLEPLEVVAQ